MNKRSQHFPQPSSIGIKKIKGGACPHVWPIGKWPCLWLGWLSKCSMMRSVGWTTHGGLDLWLLLRLWSLPPLTTTTGQATLKSCLGSCKFLHIDFGWPPVFLQMITMQKRFRNFSFAILINTKLLALALVAAHSPQPPPQWALSLSHSVMPPSAMKTVYILPINQWPRFQLQPHFLRKAHPDLPA